MPSRGGAGPLAVGFISEAIVVGVPKSIALGAEVQVGVVIVHKTVAVVIHLVAHFGGVWVNVGVVVVAVFVLVKAVGVGVDRRCCRVCVSGVRTDSRFLGVRFVSAGQREQGQ